MFQKYISTSVLNSIDFTDEDTMLILIKDVLVSSSTEGIVATGDAFNRTIVVDGEISAGAAGIVFGASTVKDLNGAIVISSTGSIHAARAGISAISDGMEVVNRGTVEARLTSVYVSGIDTRLTNEGTLTSLASNAVDIAGASAMIVNNGRLAGQIDSVRLSGHSSVVTNNGSIGAASGDGIVASGYASILTNNGAIGTRKHGIFATGASDIITNNGKIGSGGSAIVAKGAEAVVTNSGTLSAGRDGVALYGDDGIVTNRKSIEVGGFALRVSADGTTVNNLGTLKGAVGIDVTGTDARVVNSGSITSWKGSAVDFTDVAKGSFNNTGVIAASSGLAFKGGNGQQSLTNHGTIKGDVEFGGGTDYFDGTGGNVMGHVAGGKGNDTYVISDSKTILLEGKAAGRDAVSASVSYALGENFENLTLTGGRAINATGNAAANHLHGNSVANRIDGQAGNDVMWGHGGSDILTGGDGADQFVFATGDGRDIITDFVSKGSAHDTLDLSGMSAIFDFKDLISYHVKQVGADVLINALDGDSILLKNMTVAHLDKGDFLF